MKALCRVLGTIIYGVTKAYSFLLRGFVSLLETGILMVKSFLRGCALLISMGGCLAIVLLVGPVGRWLITHPGSLLILIAILAFPLLGALSVTYLNYFETVSTQYLYNLVHHLKDPSGVPYHPFKHYRDAYRQAEEAEARRKQQRREQQRRAWEEQFRNWHNQDHRQTASNPYINFKQKYQECCEALGLPVTTDPSKIKLAYRRKAKMYHPDINKDANATQQFQAIQDAYEFLNEDNIQRYKRISQQ
jgi:hypothetical protein